ncbi:M57 family metalloprotease [Pendulispora rubella]|uniref:M57 family metalloprotease n=2 Tax=Pendulispora rubella TaxID=2741070 RepID=A0ABZ2L0U7_9BACT
MKQRFRSMRLASTLVLLAVGVASGAGCGTDASGSAVEDVRDTQMSFEEFEATVYREPDTGIYIVNGDTPLQNRDELKAFFDQYIRQGALIVNRVGDAVDRWDDNQKVNISYCVSTSFGSNYNTVVSAMANAAAAWSNSAYVVFRHLSAQDGACTASNTNVVFDVRPVSGQPYLARAFFPSYARANRNVLIDSSSFGNTAPWTLTGILRHELGHTIGFRHEHTRPESGRCFEDNNWYALTSYDSASVMHYPQCNGTQTGDLVLTARDREGVALLYGTGFNGGGVWMSGWCSHSGASFGQADFNGDGRDDIWCHDPMNNSAGNTWVALSNGSAFTGGGVWMSGWCSHSGATFGTADFNGDNRADIWCHDPMNNSAGNTWVALSTGSGFTGGGVWMGGWCSHSGATFGQADFNGDGRDDIWCHDPTNNSAGNTWVALSTGSGFTGGGVWMGGWCGHAGATFGTSDFNGDNRADIWCHDPINGSSAGNTWVALSTGGGFTGGGVWMGGWCSHSGATFGQADFNGDNRADIWCHDPINGSSAGNTWVALSTGSGFTGGGVWMGGWCSHAGATFGQADFNGDNRDDIWCHDPTNNSAGNTWVALSTGSGFSGGGTWLSGWCSHSGATFGTGLFNGDAKADVWCHDPMNNSAGNTWVATAR